MQHTTTPRHIPHHTFCISVAPCLNWLQYSPSHHISHRTIIHIKSLGHHVSAHHSTSRPHSTYAHNHKYKLHHTIPQHTFHTAFQPSHSASHRHVLTWRKKTFHITRYSTTTFHILMHHSTPLYSTWTTPLFHIASHFTTSSDIAWHHM